MRISATTAFVLIILGSVTFFGCEEKKKQQHQRTAKGDVRLGGSLDVAVKAIPEAMTPTNMKSNSAVEIGIHVLEGLVRLDPKTSKIVPGVAESWSVDDAKSSYVFNLYRGVKFHPSSCDGNNSRELTTEDVVYSFEQLVLKADTNLFTSTLGGKLKGAEEFRAGAANSISGLVVIDDYTVKIELQKPDESFLYLLVQPSLGIVSNEIGTNCEEANPTGAGPFVVASNKPLVLTRYADYHHKDEFGNRFPYLDTLTFAEFPMVSDQMQAFFDGQIDVVSRLELDPIRTVLEEHVANFSGKQPQYIMRRESESASYETYCFYRSNIRGLNDGFLGYRDFTQVQIEQ